MSKKTDIVLSVSAVAATLSAFQQVATESPDRVIAIRACASDFQGEIDAALSGVQVECELQKMMGVVLPKMSVDVAKMEDAWIRLAHSQTLIEGQAFDGGPNAQGRGAGRLVGPNTDSTVSDGIGRSGLTTCYTNCHSACHGSRGWR